MIPHRTFRPLLAATLALLILATPLAAQAQALPAYARPEAGSGDTQSIRGRIESVDGAYHLMVRDERGFVDSVQLEQQTIISPSGLTLAPGMNVMIAGYDAGSAFDATAITCPYAYAGAYPAPVYYGPAWWYPGFAYGYGPAFSLNLVSFGRGYGYVHRRFHGRPWYWSRPYYGRASYGQFGRRFSGGWPYYRQASYGWYGRPHYGGGFQGYQWRGERTYVAPAMRSFSRVGFRR
ncbi:MAG TPA: hypothetical protein VE591_10575 [Candidatus Acidoferrum sp.]|nr:hypothetical protein [Candidatus Acidoferrum sp.]